LLPEIRIAAPEKFIEKTGGSIQGEQRVEIEVFIFRKILRKVLNLQAVRCLTESGVYRVFAFCLCQINHAF